MSAPKPKSNDPSDSLYERDFFLWTQQQAEALRKAAREGSNLPLDWENLAEETESLGRSFKHEAYHTIYLCCGARRERPRANQRHDTRRKRPPARN